MAHAEPTPTDDGYCDFVEGGAEATAAPLEAPQLFTQFGYIEQPTFAVTPSTDTSNLRAILGLRYSLTNIYRGVQTKNRAKADCRRHNALESLRGTTTARALAARAKVFDDAQAEADKILSDATADLDAHRMTAQDAVATRLRVEELRNLAASTKTELAALPPAVERPIGDALAAYRTADSDLEQTEAKLRKISAYEVNIRFGADKFLQGPNTDIQGFAVLELGLNLGALWLGNGNAKSAAGRARFARSGHDTEGLNAATDQMRVLLELETKRSEQTSALVADLDHQLQALSQIAGDDSKRFRETIWFESIKAKADLAYLQTHVATLKELLKGQ